MADVTVKVQMDPGWEDTIKTLPSVKGALTKEAKAMCDKANSHASGFRSGYHVDSKTKEKIGGTPAKYASMTTRVFGSEPVALVYTANYAAKKDNLKNDTLLKVF